MDRGYGITPWLIKERVAGKILEKFDIRKKIVDEAKSAASKKVAGLLDLAAGFFD